LAKVRERNHELLVGVVPLPILAGLAKVRVENDKFDEE
jgi:hypothetical protein